MKQNFFIMYILIVGVQLLICNYVHVSAYITLSLLPAAILCLPTKVGTVPAMLCAFITGLGVDFLAEGLIGLNVFALVGVAGARRMICDSFFGKELTLTGEDPSMRKFGIPKTTMALLCAHAIFLLLYIWADGASARPFLFNALRFIISLVVSTLVSLPVVHLLDPNERK